MMPVDEILQYVTGSVDICFNGREVDWFEIFAAKVSHDHFDTLVDTLIEQGFTMPIVLGESHLGGYIVGNGHHRLCAAILLGFDEIPVIIDREADFLHFDDTHDGEWNPGTPSYDYWHLLVTNMEGDHCGDEYNRAHRLAFNVYCLECQELREECECLSADLGYWCECGGWIDPAENYSDCECAPSPWHPALAVL